MNYYEKRDLDVERIIRPLLGMDADRFFELIDKRRDVGNLGFDKEKAKELLSILESHKLIIAQVFPERDRHNDWRISKLVILQDGVKVGEAG